MHEKITELHQLLRTFETANLAPQATIHNNRITILMNEILNVFGLPQNQGYEYILMKLGDAPDLSVGMVDEILIELADAGLDYRTTNG
jgi:hypothetical protein